MFRRDARRFEAVLGSTDRAAARRGRAGRRELRHRSRDGGAELGFAGVAPNSIDAVSNRDFVLDFLAAAATCATHLSRLGAEIVLWSSRRVRLLRGVDAWASGSSIMPQKKNPDAAELLRAKAPRVVGHLAALHGVMHGLPLTYNKDMQEDKEHLFDAVDTLELCLQAARGMLGGHRRSTASGWPAAASDEMIAAVDVADMLVRRGVPFRQSHGIVAGLVREAVDSGRHAVPAHARGAGASTPRRSTTSTTPSSPALVAGVEGLGGRDGAGPRARAAGPRAARRWTASRLDPLRAFYDRPVLEVAPALLGCVVAHGDSDRRDRRDRGLPLVRAGLPRLSSGVTPRTRVLYGPPGTAYVYRSYGIHALLNAVCEPEGVGAAVLIRALEPLAGIGDVARRRRGRVERALQRPGEAHPGARHRARARTGRDLLSGPVAIAAPASRVTFVTGPRIGITKAAELPWRFCVAGRPRRLPALAAGPLLRACAPPVPAAGARLRGCAGRGGPPRRRRGRRRSPAPARRRRGRRAAARRRPCRP